MIEPKTLCQLPVQVQLKLSILDMIFIAEDGGTASKICFSLKADC